MCPLTTRHEARSERKTAAKVKALREGLTQKRDCAQRIQKRGDARVQCKTEASRMRRAVAGNCSANDTAKTRETDISAKKVKET